MTFFKIIISTFLVFSVTFLCTPVIHNNATGLNVDQDNHLTKEEMNMLNELYEIDPNFTSEGELVSVSKKIQALESEEDYLKNYDGPSARGAIGSNYMTIYITVSRVPDSGKDTFNITATATWKMVPTFRMQDVFAIAWSDNFALISSSATTSYKGMGITSGKTDIISQAPNCGIGYSVECSHYYGQALDWVRINAKISKLDSSGNANVCAAYCHRKASLGGIGINFGKDPSIAFNVFGLEDQMANSTTFSY